ncbi:sulfite exporter TauE/SafE family protein [Aerococcaceae bacterium NML210727]|nr:sulfite exporter TauE/SafE family protein [Aerococcaceae bacterium NML210727]MCW6654522.1 sulfite exporter TauE/SafE family protein [Aerococcaceae bacterium NML201296]MCW6665953.1 sulfite exporter TauE/SafE family protein [Aerococcaceae bacterium NML190938]
MRGIIYFIVIVLSNAVGALSGMGGGVIIKPVFDLVGIDPVASVSFYSTIAVFTMSIVSTFRQIKNGVALQWSVAKWLVVGSVVGGALGNVVFSWLLSTMQNDVIVKGIQIILMLVTLVFVLAYNHYRWQSWQLQGAMSYFLCSLVTGFLSSLLGIGGGPINVALLMLCFGMPIKLSTVYSIIIIFASQLAKLVAIGFDTGFAVYELSVLFYIIPAAIIGGILGATLSKIMPDSKVSMVFNAVVLLVILINLYNGWQLFVG